MSENPHYKAACYDALNPEARALQAMLALAYEQRTANLIALEALLQRDGCEVEVESITDRLGLG